MTSSRPLPPTTPRASRRTSQRAAVEATLVADGGFRSAQDVYATMRAAGHQVGLSTVYRHLQAFTEQGLVDVLHNADGESTYRYCGSLAAGQHHHHHLVCRSCGRAEEIGSQVIERWAEKLATEHGYVDVEHTIEVHGTCGDCAADQQ